MFKYKTFTAFFCLLLSHGFFASAAVPNRAALSKMQSVKCAGAKKAGCEKCKQQASRVARTLSTMTDSVDASTSRGFLPSLNGPNAFGSGVNMTGQARTRRGQDLGAAKGLLQSTEQECKGLESACNPSVAGPAGQQVLGACAEAKAAAGDAAKQQGKGMDGIGDLMKALGDLAKAMKKPEDDKNNQPQQQPPPQLAAAPKGTDLNGASSVGGPFNGFAAASPPPPVQVAAVGPNPGGSRDGGSSENRGEPNPSNLTNGAGGAGAGGKVDSGGGGGGGSTSAAASLDPKAQKPEDKDMFSPFEINLAGGSPRGNFSGTKPSGQEFKDIGGEGEGKGDELAGGDSGEEGGEGGDIAAGGPAVEQGATDINATDITSLFRVVHDKIFECKREGSI